MKASILLAVAVVALGACSHNLAAGKRTNYRCEGGKEFSTRDVAGSVEVYASGQTHLLRPSGEGAYASGDINFTEDGNRATLTGVYNGPFEDCRGRPSQSWRPTLW